MVVDSGEVVRTVNVFEGAQTVDEGTLVSDSNLSDDATPEQTTEILSESAIKVAKEKRDRLRKATDAGEEDFISLSLTRRSDDIGPHPDSRLVREEDELGEAEEGKPAHHPLVQQTTYVCLEFADYTSAQDRIALGKKSRKVEAAKRREAMKEMIEDVYANCWFLHGQSHSYISVRTKTKKRRNGSQSSFEGAVIVHQNQLLQRRSKYTNPLQVRATPPSR
jgi:Nineteen complex-related protein 2